MPALAESVIESPGHNIKPLGVILATAADATIEIVHVVEIPQEVTMQLYVPVAVTVFTVPPPDNGGYQNMDVLSFVTTLITVLPVPKQNTAEGLANKNGVL